MDEIIRLTQMNNEIRTVQEEIGALKQEMRRATERVEDSQKFLPHLRQEWDYQKLKERTEREELDKEYGK